VDDLLEALTAPCADCGKAGPDSQVTFAAAWLAYLCAGCRAKRNDDELRVPLVIKDAMREVARDITAAARMVRDMQNRSEERGSNG